jgi:hypothetical protein
VIDDVPVFVSLVAVIVTVPTPTAVTRPLEDTVATAMLSELHVTTRSVSTVPVASFVTAVSCCVGVTPSTRLAVAGVTVTVATGTGSTVIAGVVALGAVSLVAVIVAIPTPVAVAVTVAPVDVLTVLAALTDSTVGLLETHVTVRPLRVAPFAPLGVAVKTCV